MKVLQAFRYDLDTNNVQGGLLARHAGTARFAYNWGLAERKRLFEMQEGKAKFTSAMEQHRALNRLKRADFPWMYEVSKCAPQEALRDLDQAFRNFWRERKRGSKRAGFPKLRRKGKDDRFRLTGSIHVELCGILLPRIGFLRAKESTEKFDGRILSATVSREADHWYVSLQVERERPDPRPVEGPVVGVDLGLESFAVVSGESPIEAPKPLAENLSRLAKAQRRHSRKEKGSRNRRESAIGLARLHRRIRNIRRDFLGKLTTRLAKTKSVIIVEDLSVSSMVRNRRLARAINDAGWFEFRRMLGYKTVWYGSELVVAPRRFPSTRRCSECGRDGPGMDLSVRLFRCESCGWFAGRDENAERNLRWYGQFGRNPNACGDGQRGGTEHLFPVYERPVVEAGTEHACNGR
jgi:putative transposase